MKQRQPIGGRRGSRDVRKARGREARGSRIHRSRYHIIVVLVVVVMHIDDVSSDVVDNVTTTGVGRSALTAHAVVLARAFFIVTAFVLELGRSK